MISRLADNDMDTEFIEPQAEDWITSDYHHWSVLGGHTFLFISHDNWGEELKAKMKEDNFWPNVWYVGERGDYNLLDVGRQCFAENG